MCRHQKASQFSGFHMVSEPQRENMQLECQYFSGSWALRIPAGTALQNKIPWLFWADLQEKGSQSCFYSMTIPQVPFDPRKVLELKLGTE
jgi:hypothetical protein